jgi:pSer/pThr/pTyr-binding forkhead associated (FHA) protein
MRVSREHCRLWFDPAARAYMIADLGSANGTLVEGSRLTHEQPLRGDEIVQIGSTIFRFVLHAPITDPAAVLEALRSRVRGQEYLRTSHG